MKKHMKKHVMLFLVIVVNIVYAQLGDKEFDTAYSYYYQILLDKWLKNVEPQELKPVYFETDWKTFITLKESRDKSYELLKEYYDVEYLKRSGKTTSGAGSKYKFLLMRFRELPEREQVWVLLSAIRGGRGVWIADKIDDPNWKKVNLPEIRDNNTYTFLLRKSEIDTFNQCSSLQNSKIANAVPIGGQSVDSAKAIAIAVAKAKECYGFAIMPFEAKLMGDNKEHWLVHCFSTMQNDIKEYDDTCYNYINRRYQQGIAHWNQYSSCSGKRFLIISVLISKHNGQVLFMDSSI